MSRYLVIFAVGIGIALALGFVLEGALVFHKGFNQPPFIFVNGTVLQNASPNNSSPLDLDPLAGQHMAATRNSLPNINGTRQNLQPKNPPSTIIHPSNGNKKHVILPTIWQTYRTSNLPPAAIAIQRSWRTQNPGLNLILYNDSETASFVRQSFGQEAYQVFQKFPIGVMRADFWRYAILYIKGGIYSDVDTKCHIPISKWLPPQDTGMRLPLSDRYYADTTWQNCSIVIGLEDDTNFCQWTIASVPGHPILRKTIDMIVERSKHGVDPKKDVHFVHFHTGPGVFTSAIRAYLNNKTTYQNPHGRAIDIFNAVYSDRNLLMQVKGLGVCFVGMNFFSGSAINVENLFGSQKAGSHGWDSYPSWLKERQIARGSESMWSRKIMSSVDRGAYKPK